MVWSGLAILEIGFAAELGWWLERLAVHVRVELVLVYSLAIAGVQFDNLMTESSR